MLHESKLDVECKKVESRVQTQMANTKCRIDCVKYNVKWNIEFWRKWNAIHYSPVYLGGYINAFGITTFAVFSFFKRELVYGT